MTGRRATACLAAMLVAGCGSAPTPSALPVTPESMAGGKVTASTAGLKLPDWPKPQDLIGFDLSRATRLAYAVDGTSITTADSDIVRFTLVAKGSGGAENVTYEGFRCSTGERATYAYGRADRTWREVPDPTWSPIARGDEARNVLLAYYLCPGRRAVKNAAEGANALKYGHPEATSPLGGPRIDRGF